MYLEASNISSDLEWVIEKPKTSHNVNQSHLFLVDKKENK